MGLVPNFNYTDMIWRYVSKRRGKWALAELRQLRQTHPRKFMASLRWACGSGRNFQMVERRTRKGKGD